LVLTLYLLFRQVTLRLSLEKQRLDTAINRDGGASAIANRRRGRASNNRLPDVIRDHAIALAQGSVRHL
jgi:hypothetical protein